MCSIYFFHDFGGQPNCRTARIIREYFPDDFVFAPEIPFDPNEAKEFVWDLYMNGNPKIVIGSGLGAFYAMQLGGCIKILLNPSMIPEEDTKKKLQGYTKVMFRDRFVDVDEEYFKKLKEQKEFFFSNCLDMEFRHETYAVFSKHSKLYSHIADYKKLYGNKFTEVECGHILTRKIIGNYIVPLIEKLKREVN